MKADIHPNYNEIKVTCACGNTFSTGSTLSSDLHVEICSDCHPFYTGKQKVMDTEGRVGRFKSRYGKKQSLQKRLEKGASGAFFYGASRRLNMQMSSAIFT